MPSSRCGTHRSTNFVYRFWYASKYELRLSFLFLFTGVPNNNLVQCPLDKIVSGSATCSCNVFELLLPSWFPGTFQETQSSEFLLRDFMPASAASKFNLKSR